MSTQPAISIKPVVSYPHQAQVGKTYLMTIDLESPDNEWPYEEEEYPIYCMLETAPLFSYKTLGEPAIVLHRFGGSYGAAKFLLTAAQQEMQGEITVTLVNDWGVPIRVLSFDEISITHLEIPAQETTETYERLLYVNPERVINPSEETSETHERAGDVNRERVKNPYIIGTPIETLDKLFGRESILEEIKQYLLRDEKFILLQGQRRIGKSSILKNLPAFVSSDEFYFVSCDLQGYSYEDASSFFYVIARSIIELLELPNGLIEPLLNRDFETCSELFQFEFLPKIYEVLNSRKLVLWLDEFSIFLANRETNTIIQILSCLESLVREEELYIIGVASIFHLDTLLPHFQQLFPSNPVIKIGLLDEHATRQLITKPAEGILTYEADGIQAIIELSSGHPYFTQVICGNLFHQARSEENWTLTKEKVENIVNNAIENAEGGLAALYDSLSIPERVVFALVAAFQQQNTSENILKLLEDYGLVITDELETAFQLLVNKDFIHINPIQITVELIRRWVVQRHQLRDEIRNLETIEAESINNLLRAARDLWQRNRQSNSLEIYEQILYLNPNHFNIIAELADKYLQVQNFDQAVVLYDRVYKFDPAGYQQEFIQALNEYANWLTTQRNYIKAQEQYEKILQIEPKNIVASEKLRELLNLNINQSNPTEPFIGIGRKSVIQTAFDQIYNRQHVAVWGGLGMGKTYFLKYIASPHVWLEHEVDPYSAIIVVFSCEEISPFTPSGFWRKILLQLKDNVDIELELQNKIEILLGEGRASVDSLRQILRELERKNKFLVLLLDDYDVALVQHQDYLENEMETFLAQSRNLVVGGKNCSVIVTSKKRLNELGPKLKPNASPWYNHYFFQQLRPFSTNETREFLEIFFNKPISPEFLTAIVEITGGNPALVDTASSLISRELKNSTLPNAQELVVNFESSTRQFFDNIWHRCSEVEQTLLILIVLYNLKAHLQKNVRYELSGGAIFSQHERQLRNLEAQGLIYKSRETEKYYLTSSIMERWITQEIGNTNYRTRMQATQKSLLNIMSHRQIEQFTTAIEWLQNHREQMYSEMGWMENLAAAIQRFFETIR